MVANAGISKKDLTKFTIELSRDYAKALCSYCHASKQNPEKFMRECLIKEMIDLSVFLRKEELIIFENEEKPLQTRECLKDFFNFMEKGIKASSIEKN